MVENFSQNFVVYHGCGAWYQNVTNKIVSKIENVFFQLMNHFGKTQTMFVIKWKQELNLN